MHSLGLLQNPQSAQRSQLGLRGELEHPIPRRFYRSGCWTDCRAASPLTPTSQPAPGCSASSLAEETATQTQTHSRIAGPRTPEAAGSRLPRIALFGSVSLQEERERCVISTRATASDCISIYYFFFSFPRLFDKEKPKGCGLALSRTTASRGVFQKNSTLASICKGQSGKEKPCGDPGLVTHPKPSRARSCWHLSVLPALSGQRESPRWLSSFFSCIFHSLAPGHFSSSGG